MTLIFFALWATSALAECDDIVATRTLGVEWEVMAADEDIYHLLVNSHFRELYEFYGLDESGHSVKGLIPNSMTKLPSFVEFKKSYKELFEDSEGKVFIANWANLNRNDFEILVNTLFEIRGRRSRELLIRKIPEKWIAYQTQMDQLIPDVISEEWRIFNGQNVFVGLEFSMQGHIQSGDEISAYLTHLWQRIGLRFKTREGPGTAASRTDGHVHWVPAIHSGTPEAKETFYSSVVRYWGDANDSQLLNHLVPYEVTVRLSKNFNFEMDLSYAEFVYEVLGEHFMQYSIMSLTRETFSRLRATPKGILIDHRALDLNTDVDANIPSVFKRLIMGLRGLYGRTVAPDEPISTIGLEGRSYSSAEENLRALPQTTPDGKVDIRALREHNLPGSRGLVSRPAHLVQLATRWGVDSSLINELYSLKRLGYFRMPKPLIIAELLLPLNNWLEHPLATRKLNSLSADARAAKISRYTEAFDRYRRRMNKLMESRRSPMLSYQPEWRDELKLFLDGFNRVFSRSSFPELASVGQTNSDPDIWFTIIVASEMVRFVAESGVADIVSMK